MSTNAITNALLYKKIDGVEVPVYYQTLVECVKILEEGGEVSLATKLADMVAAINKKASTSDLTSAVTEAVAKLVDGAPEELDTLKELAELASSNKDLMTALNTSITGKVDKEEGKSLVADSVITIVSKITNAKITAWDAAQANVMESITHNGTKLDIDENKNVNLTTTKMTMGSSFPADMKNGDFHILTPAT